MTLFSLATATVAVLVGLSCPSARAATTLTYEWTDIRCGVMGADGSRTSQPCATTSFSALISPGESVYVSANLSYVYHDDGLALAQAVILHPSPTNQIVLDHEAAVLGLISSACYDFRSCSSQAADHVDYFSGAGGPLIFGNNLVADDLSGERSFFASSGVPSSYPFGPLQRSVSFGVGVAFTYAGVTPPVPEPSSHALMLAGLFSLAWVARRRSQRLLAA